jgi:hypothetical protein
MVAAKAVNIKGRGRILLHPDADVAKNVPY